MNDPWEWDEADIQGMIQNQIREDISLDYKACASLDSSEIKKTEVSKDVSAFANSAGGTIVYGVIEQGYLPTGIDHGFDPAVVSREWLEQVINSRIKRRPDGVRINQVVLGGQRAGRVLYVVSIRQNNGFPYQAFDKRFYKRFNFQSVAMEEYEIQDVARRAEVPALRVDLRFTSGKSTSLAFPGAEHQSTNVRLVAEIENTNPVPAEYIWFSVYVDTRVNVSDFDPLSGPRNGTAVTETNRYPVKIFEHYRAIPTYPPIWQGASSGTLSPSIRVRFPQRTNDYVVGWIVRTPRMAERTGVVTIHVDHLSDAAQVREYNSRVTLDPPDW